MRPKHGPIEAIGALYTPLPEPKYSTRYERGSIEAVESLPLPLPLLRRRSSWCEILENYSQPRPVISRRAKMSKVKFGLCVPHAPPHPRVIGSS